MTADRDQDRSSEYGGNNDGNRHDENRSGSGHGNDENSHDRDEQDEQEEDDDHDQDDRPPLYKRPLFWLIFGAVAIVLIVGGLLFWLHARKFESTDDAFVDAHVVRLAAQVSGQLTAVANVDNRHVRAGALLATIETDATQATVEQARAQLLQAQAQIEQAQAQVASARAQRAQAVAEAVQPEAQAAKAQADLKRYLALHQIDAAAVAGTQIDQARAQADSSAGQAAAARRAIDNADAQIAVAEKQVKAAQAQKVGAQAQIDSAKVTYGHLDIRAPVDGQVVNRSVNVGSYVQAGSQLMAIVPDRMWVTANFKETQLALMRLGQPVDISVDAFPDVHFAGHIDSIQRGAGQAFALLPPQNATGNYVKVVQRVPVRILFDRRNQNDPDPHHYAIGPGMSVVPTVRVR